MTRSYVIKADLHGVRDVAVLCAVAVVVYRVGHHLRNHAKLPALPARVQVARAALLGNPVVYRTLIQDGGIVSYISGTHIVETMVDRPRGYAFDIHGESDPAKPAYRTAGHDHAGDETSAGNPFAAWDDAMRRANEILADLPLAGAGRSDPTATSTDVLQEYPIHPGYTPPAEVGDAPRYPEPADVKDCADGM